MFAVIHLPHFALQAVLRHAPEWWAQPVALVDPENAPPVVCAVTRPARQAGVTEGLTPTQAMARCGGIQIRHRSRPQETAASEALLQCAYGFSPHLEATGPGLMTLDLRGLSALSAGEASVLMEWAKKLRAAGKRLQLHARIGLGPTPQVARQAAGWGRSIQIVTEPESFLAGLPVAALEPSPPVAKILQKWGIRTVGELCALGAEALTERLGLEALELLAAASTRASRPLRLTQPSDRFVESLDFEEAIESVEPLLFILNRFVQQLSARLEPTGMVAESLVLRLRLESGQRLRRPLPIPQPTRQPEVWMRMLRTHLEGMTTDSAIQAVALQAIPVSAEQKQFGLFEAALRDPQRFQETLARLTTLFGPERVGSPVLEDSHRSDAFRLRPPDFENVPSPDPMEPIPVFPIVAIRRLRPAMPVQVETESDSGENLSTRGASPRPIAIQGALMRGKLRGVFGPWRSSGHWWETKSWERDEWDVSLASGQTLRLVRQATGWFVEGIVD